MAEIEGYETSQVDVAHRSSRKIAAPIIVLFQRKSNRQNFDKQKNKLYLLNLNQFLDGILEVDQGGEENLNKNCFIFLDESLTGGNRKLLMEAKKLAKGLHYKLLGYTINGQVRVRKSEKTDYIAIRNVEDLHKIT